MNDIERRIADIMLTKLRERDPSLSYDDLERPVGDLDLDSLDIVELTQLMERELQGKADLQETASFGLLQDFTAYFVKLADQ